MTLTFDLFTLEPREGSGILRIDPLRFLAGCRTRRLNQALSVPSLSLKVSFDICVVLLTRDSFWVVLVLCYLCVLSLGCSGWVVSSSAM